MEVLEEDVCLSPKWLSLGGKVMLFKVPTERSPTNVTFCSFSFKREDSAFLKTADGAAVVGRKGLCPAVVVICKSVTDVRRRVRAPYVLVAKRMQKGANVQYSLLMLSSSNELETCVEFKLPYEMGDNVAILQGPTVLWTHEGDVFYSTLHTGEVKQISTQFSHIIFGELPLHKGQIFALGLPKDNSRDRSNTSILGLIVEEGHFFDGGLIIPHAYMCITQCLLVLSAKKVDSVLKCAAVAATSNRQLVYFEDGIVKNVCQLPFEEPQLIQVVHTGRNGSLFAITFAHDHVCAVWKATFEVASQWSDVSTVLVDDFLGCGTDQMLLVFKDRDMEEKRLDHFLITDLCGISYSEKGHEQTSGCPSETFLSTLNALEDRLQSGSMELQDLQGEARATGRVLLQSVKALTDVGSARRTHFTQFEQENLLPLWDYDQDDDDDGESSRVLDDEMHDEPAVPSKPQIDRLWHRVIEDRLVVGVKLTTDSSIQLDALSLSIMTEPGQSLTPAVMETQSQVFLVPNSSSSPSMLGEPAAKRNKPDNVDEADDPNRCRLVVTAVTRLTPLLNSGSVKCPVMLHYVQRQHQASSPHVSTSAPAVLHCGQAAFDIGSVFQTQLLSNPKLRTDEVREDLWSLLAVLDHWAFIIDSPEHSLGDVDGWIKRKVGCEIVEVNPQYLLFNSSAPSAVMLLHWHQRTPFHGELSVHSSQVRMLQFLHSLMSYLPASCSIQPVRCPGRKGSSQTSAFSLALEKELVCLKDGLLSLLCVQGQDESTGHEQGQTPESSASRLPHREVWQGSVKNNDRVDIASYRKLTQSLTKIQLDVDMAASLLFL
ncbi:Fanconi anemia group B protein [Genypterus blacodes]|uniref:Fanconi anemia group B protein n=1 Tax=Genypterus blacodes TaxID=154954 RepID=UPI003F759686